MTEYTSSNRIIGTLIQIKEAIKQLQDWNKDVQTVDDYYCTPEGMKNLAAGANPIVMRRGMKKATDAAVEAIKNMSQKVSGKKQIANVASISAGDKEVGEGVKQIDRLTQSRLLNERPEIPWQDVIGIRNHIAHGYFDIDGDIVFDVIKNNLDDLLAAINYFISKF